MTRGLRVHATGPLALVQDLGRRGLSGVGVGRSGAADRGSLRQLNRALANPADDKLKPVFDPSIRGKTDQFIYKFRKPA